MTAPPRAPAAAPGTPAAASPSRHTRAVAGALFLLALASGPLLAVSPTLALLGAAGLLLIAAVVVWPTQAVIAYVAVNPLIVGLDRGAVVPGLRLNEVLMAPVLGGLVLVAGARWFRGAWRWPRAHPLDVVVLVLAVTSSVTTLLWMYAHGRDITSEDLQYALALWKLAVLYAMVRLFVHGRRATRAVLLVMIASACLVGVLGLLQTVGVGPVLDLLNRLIPPGQDSVAAAGGRATSTIGNPHAFGDVLVYTGLVAGSLAVSGPRNRLLLAVVAVALGACSLASGSFSTALALATAGLVFAVLTRTSHWLLTAVILLSPLAYLGLQPVVASRLNGLDPTTGLPASWTDRYGRLDNLRTFFWPRIAEDFNWLLGVRTTSRVPGESGIRPWVYIESGYTWALWNGGLPLLIGVLVLLVVMYRTGRRLRPTGSVEVRALGIVLSVLAWVLAVLMIMDPHLTIRGGAEILFVLLALCASADAARPAPFPSSPGRVL